MPQGLVTSTSDFIQRELDQASRRIQRQEAQYKACLQVYESCKPGSSLRAITEKQVKRYFKDLQLSRKLFEELVTSLREFQKEICPQSQSDIESVAPSKPLTKKGV